MYLQPSAVAQLLETTAGLQSCHTGSGTSCCDRASGQAGLLVVNTLAVLPVALGPFDVQALRSCWVCTRSSPPGGILLTQPFIFHVKHHKHPHPACAGSSAPGSTLLTQAFVAGYSMREQGSVRQKPHIYRELQSTFAWFCEPDPAPVRVCTLVALLQGWFRHPGHSPRLQHSSQGVASYS
jgi:hypothetical protein